MPRQDWFQIAQEILSDSEWEDAAREAVLRKQPERLGDIPEWFARQSSEDIEAELDRINWTGGFK